MKKIFIVLILTFISVFTSSTLIQANDDIVPLPSPLPYTIVITEIDNTTYAYDIEFKYPKEAVVLNFFIPLNPDLFMLEYIDQYSNYYNSGMEFFEDAESRHTYDAGELLLEDGILDKTYSTGYSVPFYLDDHLNGLVANRVKIRLISTESYNNMEASLEYLSKNLSFFADVLEGLAYFYNLGELFEMKYFKGTVTEPVFVPTHPEGYTFSHWEHQSGKFRFNELFPPVFLEDGKLILNAAYVIPDINVDKPVLNPNVPDSVGTLLTFFGINNTTGHIFLFVLVMVILFIILAITHMPLIVYIITLIVTSLFFNYLGILPAWILIVNILICLIVFMLKESRSSI